mgnify:CR=1 FL=1
MTSFVHIDHPAQHPGVVRAERVAELIGQLLSGSVVIRALAAIGAPATAALQRWAEARRQARDDAAYWRAALGDARIMADISRAMDASGRDVDAYWQTRA